MASSMLVIGCSEQIPNEMRAYHLMGTSSEGTAVLSRHGETYSAASGEVSSYHEVLARMLHLALESLPPNLRERARVALISRWNRDWGVQVEDLDDHSGVIAGGERVGCYDEVSRNFGLDNRVFGDPDGGTIIGGGGPPGSSP